MEESREENQHIKVDHADDEHKECQNKNYEPDQSDEPEEIKCTVDKDSNENNPPRNYLGANSIVEETDVIDSEKEKEHYIFNADRVLLQINQDPFKTIEKMWKESKHPCTECENDSQSINEHSKNALHDSDLKSESNGSHFKCLRCAALNKTCTVLFCSKHKISNNAKESKEHAMMSETYKQQKKQQQCICPHCKKIFTKKDLYLSHVTKHEKGENFWACRNCDFKKNSAKALQKHIIKSHFKQSGKEKDIICPICGEHFTDDIKYIRHRLKSHRKKQKPSERERDIPEDHC